MSPCACDSRKSRQGISLRNAGVAATLGAQPMMMVAYCVCYRCSSLVLRRCVHYQQTDFVSVCGRDNPRASPVMMQFANEKEAAFVAVACTPQCAPPFIECELYVLMYGHQLQFDFW